MSNTILIIGGDKRQDTLYGLLKKKDYNCFRENKTSDNILSEVSKHKILILPVPFTADGEYIYSNNPDFTLSVSDLLSALSDKNTVIAGGMSSNIRNQMKAKKVKHYDMTDSDYFTEYNAFLTSQGALKLLFDNTLSLVTGKKVLITGFGRVAEALAYNLKGIGTDVFILARNPRQLMKAQCLGCKTVNMAAKSSVICLFDYIFNTVPSPVFPEADVFRMRDDTVYFELASKPFGADKADFLKHGKKYIYGGGLPGRFVSDSAAEIMAEFIINTVKENFYE